MGGLKPSSTFMGRLLDWVERWSNATAVVLLVFLMALVTLDVTYRFLAGKSIVGAYELSELIMVGICFPTLAYCQRQMGHVRVDILVDRLRGRARHFTEALALFLCLVIGVLMSYQAIVEALHTVDIGLVTSGLIKWPAWPFKIVLAYGMCLFSITIGTQFAQQIRLLIAGGRYHAI